MNRIIPGFLMSCLLLAACDRSVPYEPDADALGHTARRFKIWHHPIRIFGFKILHPPEV